MRSIKLKSVFFLFSLYLLASIAGLWAWNTLAEVFPLPVAQYRHILAAMVLLLMFKWLLAWRPSKHRQATGGRHASIPH